MPEDTPAQQALGFAVLGTNTYRLTSTFTALKNPAQHAAHRPK